MDDRTIQLGPHLVSGVIDNSVKGRTTGHLVFDGLDEPVLLDLAGNAKPDLAGCVVRFRRNHSEPLEPDVAELLESPQRGPVGRITAAGKSDARVTGREPVVPVLDIQWLNVAWLLRFVIEAEGCEFDIDLPRWTLSEDETAFQQRECESAEALFGQLCEEFEEDCLDEEISDDQFEKIDAILPRLEAAESDEEKLSLMRKALGPDVGEHELAGLFEAYFLPDFEPSFDAAPETDWTVGLLLVDEELRSLAAPLGDSARKLFDRVDAEEAPACIEELSENLGLLIFRLLVGSPLDFTDEGLLIHPDSMLRQLEEERRRCESVIAYLELEAAAGEKTAFHDLVWPLRKQLEVVAKRIRSKKPEPPSPGEGSEDDVPF
ncbi:MAG: hypothetical protein WD342_09185 [Verrucomicrobiales bacterium]